MVVHEKVNEGTESTISILTTAAHRAFGRFRIVEPKMFRIGDLVQVELSFVVIPQMGRQRKMKAILRTVALINDTFAKVSL